MKRIEGFWLKGFVFIHNTKRKPNLGNSKCVFIGGFWRDSKKNSNIFFVITF